MTGLIAGMKGKSILLGVAALKGDFLTKEVENCLVKFRYHNSENWEILRDYHFGGFAKFKPELLQFINTFRKDHQIALDPLYIGFCLFEFLFQILSNVQTLLELSRLRTNQILF